MTRAETAFFLPAGIWIAALILLLQTGCGVQKQTQLFRDEKYEVLYKEGRKRNEGIIRRFPTSADTLQFYRYRIQSGDELRIRFLNLPPELAKGSFEVKADEKYVVNIDGYLFVPLIGRVFVKDKTTEEIRKKLVQDFSQYYRSPGIDLQVSNLKVYVYGEAKQGVVILPGERTHLIEALAIAGGVPNTAKRHKIKIIRGDLKNPQIIWVDLNQIDILNDQDLFMRSGDIIYLEPRNLQLLAREVQPYTLILNLAVALPSIYLLIRSFSGG